MAQQQKDDITRRYPKAGPIIDSKFSFLFIFHGKLSRENL
jgi:hypothetical protein